MYPMKNRTLGEPNDIAGNGPRIGPLLISEVMYNPAVAAGEDPNNFEYVEIYNPTGAAVDLTHWKLGGGVDFAFTAATTIGAHQALLVLPFDPVDLTKLNNFKNKYGIGSTVNMVGGLTGHLDDGGETVQLLHPDAPQGIPPTYPGLLEDEVRYDDASPWPLEADGGGYSLQRWSALAWGDAAASWFAAAPTPGVAHVSAITGREIFYNNSRYDGHDALRSGDPAANLYDDSAIATDKDGPFARPHGHFCQLHQLQPGHKRDHDRHPRPGEPQRFKRHRLSV